MNSNDNNNPFGELPQALVEELLGQSEAVGKSLFEKFKNIQDNKSKLREEIEKSGLLKRESDFAISTPPTTCGIDGAYAKEELLSVDLLTAAAVALEGLTPPSETRYWDDPHHQAYIHEEEHNPESSTILRALMVAMEQQLAEKVPHDVVFLDGSLTTPLIFFNQAINKIKELPQNKSLLVAKEFIKVLPSALEAYRKIVGNSRTDKLWVGMPKYTTKREIGKKLKWEASYDDRALLTLLLSPGELIAPTDMEQPKEDWHLRYDESKKDVDAIINSLKHLKVMYYKPHPWSLALRIELNASAGMNEYQVGMVVQALKFQCAAPGVFEPYPLFIADRMVKSLGTALPAFRQVVTRQMGEEYDGDLGEVFFTMHGHRTEKSK